MEYKEKLGHLNFPELAMLLGLDLDKLLEAVSQKKELMIKDIPVIVTYGDLCSMQGVLFRAFSTFAEVCKNIEDNELFRKSDESFHELSNLFKYIDGVLMDGNIKKEAIHKLDPTIPIP